MWEPDRGRRHRSPGDGRTILRFSGTERGGKINDDQDSDGLACADLRQHAASRRGLCRRSEELLDFMQLADRPKTMIADYSHGMQKKLALAAAVIHGPRILFLDEPFEGVDALEAGALKALLGRMTERGTTIFLTSHVLEIVERLCSHVAIIHKGRLVAQGSLEELRAGISGEAGNKTTLEQIFLSIVGQDGTERPQLEELSWLM